MTTLTLSQQAERERDPSRQAVLRAMVIQEPFFRALPFLRIDESPEETDLAGDLATANFYTSESGWTTDTSTFTPTTWPTVIIGSENDYDGVHNDLVLQQMGRAIATAFMTQFVVGDTAVGGQEDRFDGVRKLVTLENTFEQAVNGGVPTLPLIDRVIYSIPQKPSALLMSWKTHLGVRQTRRVAGPTLETSSRQFGDDFVSYTDIPTYYSHVIPHDEVQGSSSVTTSIFGVRFGVGTGLVGIENGPLTYTFENGVHRVHWDVGIQSWDANAISRLKGITTF